MRGRYEHVKRNVVAFAARFGFVTKKIFTEHLCPLKRTQQHELWARLFREKILVTSRSMKDVAYLTTKGRAFYMGRIVPGRPPFLIPHDLLVAELLLALQASGLLEQYWTEHDLKADLMEAHHVLGTSHLIKYPDLVLQMRSNTGSLKIAVEIERSQKAKARYDQMALSFLQAKGVSFLIFGCESPMLQSVILSAFSGDLYVKAGKVPATFLLEEFRGKNLEMEAQFMGYKMPFRRMLLAALKLPESAWPQEANKVRTAVRSLSGEEKFTKGKIA